MLAIQEKKHHKPGITILATLRLVAVSNALLLSASVIAESLNCHPQLWPVNSGIGNPIFPVPQDTRVTLQYWSKKIMRTSAHPIAILSSAGKTDLADPGLIASRRALQDAGNMAVLALSYHVSNNKTYLNKIKEVLLLWAAVNQPTGHPIDETKLDGLIWAYDLIACDLSPHDNEVILSWFERMRLKKIAWKFEKQTNSNNHRIHQLKMLLLLDKILQRQEDWVHDRQHAETYSPINLNPQTGISVDYIQRGSLFYHNYALQPWLEISLLTDCCRSSTNQAFIFLVNKIVTDRIKHEFVHSKVKIDFIRAKNGFAYAKRDGQFDVTKASATIVTYYTLNPVRPNSKLWLIVQRTKPTSWMIFINARRALWPK